MEALSKTSPKAVPIRREAGHRRMQTQQLGISHGRFKYAMIKTAMGKCESNGYNLIIHPYPMFAKKPAEQTVPKVKHPAVK